MLLSKFFGHIFLGLGSLLMLVSLINFMRYKNDDAIVKMHVLATGESLGFLLFLIGTAIYFQLHILTCLKLMIIAMIFWLSNAVTSHNLARAAFLNKK